MHSGAGSCMLYELRSGVYATTHCLSSTIMVAVLLLPVALTSKIEFTRRGVPSLCAMRINRHCKKNHSQSRQKLVRSSRVHAVYSSTLFVAEMVLDTTVVEALEIGTIGRYVERTSCSFSQPPFVLSRRYRCARRSLRTTNKELIFGDAIYFSDRVNVKYIVILSSNVLSTGIVSYLFGIAISYN